MGLKLPVRAVTAFLLGAVILAPMGLTHPQKITAQQIPEANSQPTAIPTYPESSDGLKSLLQDWFAAIKAGDTAKSSQYLESFAIPNHQEWFVKTFGAAEGARLDARYAESQAGPMSGLKAAAEQAVKNESFFVEAKVFDKSTAASEPLLEEVSTAMVQPTPIYGVSSRRDKEDVLVYPFGNYVYVEGGFRCLGSVVMEALGTTPGLRVIVPGNAQAAKLIYFPRPPFPREARAQKVWGNVVLHVIIAKDGTVRQIRVVSGPPLLVPVTIDVVKQWRYQPTMLRGKPVEVDTEVTAGFARPQ